MRHRAKEKWVEAINFKMNVFKRRGVIYFVTPINGRKPIPGR